MDIKELDKKQLILLTLLITFVVSIATGIVTVSLMNQMPKSVPQTINNVIQKTIEKITTVQVPSSTTSENITNNQVATKENNGLILGSSDTLVNIYLNNIKTPNTVSTEAVSTPTEVSLGQGIIISEEGLVLVDSSLVNDKDLYKVILNKKDFNVSILKKFNNGFTILKISPILEKSTSTLDPSVKKQ
ncbi:MAG: hypothetical protein NTU81_02540 [Candidatus Nomurabacteria bacterium]|nr:hypothetical protein [Candidatus Nomurabacteria bacterium]